LSTVHPFSPDKVTEYVTHSWYRYPGGDGVALHPYDGVTDPHYTGPQPPYKYLETDQKYSWLKTPRYEDRPMEVGPLARMVVAYASGQKEVVETVNFVLNALKAPASYLFSTLGRTAARAIESKIMAARLKKWVEELADNMGRGNLSIANTGMWDPASWPKSARGFGYHEAPRGALGHWVEIENKAIKNYQCVVPSTWNASPRDAQGVPGPYESALLDTPLPIPDQPVEILRTIHSFDPCLACAVHVVDGRGRRWAEVRGR
jgi:hydrogenase large subunit